MEGPLGQTLVAAFLKEHRFPLGLTFSLLGPVVHTALIEKGIEIVRDFSLPFCIMDDPSASFLTSDTPCFVDELSVLPFPTDGEARNVWYMALSPAMVFIGGKGIQYTRSQADTA